MKLKSDLPMGPKCFHVFDKVTLLYSEINGKRHNHSLEGSGAILPWQSAYCSLKIRVSINAVPVMYFR